ncbi:MAG TPA: saccharopine dehydrogenase C-terminal domain-containing protein [Ferruginibacter sp.]|nr:saccharopine dehydrogenase NADP-binding domain-containing protein [Bacteroidota bacterium]MCC6693102.1 saccharopine dehydrogenase NADP-binding domain-containing protein [Chitinophagaceae bacterium]HMT95818.1 saccharopine dehydrogenase C-terminal domain-containing protein [Ferruginibacter sp.]HRD42833.1 saccharopine dehydrogenase C-terminal domain-containing protein [Ferruginibacter sp.]
MKIAVLGAGMVGRTIAVDLSKNFDTTSIDINQDNLNRLAKYAGLKTLQADLSNYTAYSNLLMGFDMVVCAVPGFMGYKTLEAIIGTGKNVVDISFFPEDALALDALAKEKGVTAIVDCGVAPGLSNWVLGHYNNLMKIESFECMVGGLPKLRTKPWEYKAPFSPVDVIEEYTRPARYVSNAEMVTRPALSDAELIDFPIAGTLESFNTDGLRSILYTMKHIPNMKEKTLRYPGHIALIQSLQKAGFFSTDKVQVKDAFVTPLAFTSALLINQWKLGENEPEFTIMTICCKGLMENKPATVEYFLYDENDAASGFSSMSRTTGYTCTAAVHLLSEKKFVQKGVFPPELVANTAGTFEYIVNYLSERGVKFEKKMKS